MTKTKVIVFLQNAWSPLYAGGEWPRHSWLCALSRSRSGVRLRHLIPYLDVCENTTPIVGADPSSIIPPDEAHIRSILTRRRPAYVVTCGRQAEKTLLELWHGPMVALPHPACRIVTNELFRYAGNNLDQLAPRRVAVRQLRGKFKIEPLKGITP